MTEPVVLTDRHDDDRTESVDDPTALVIVSGAGEHPVDEAVSTYETVPEEVIAEEVQNTEEIPADDIQDTEKVLNTEDIRDIDANADIGEHDAIADPDEWYEYAVGSVSRETPKPTPTRWFDNPQLVFGVIATASAAFVVATVLIVVGRTPGATSGPSSPSTVAIPTPSYTYRPAPTTRRHSSSAPASPTPSATAEPALPGESAPAAVPPSAAPAPVQVLPAPPVLPEPPVIPAGPPLPAEAPAAVPAPVQVQPQQEPAPAPAAPSASEPAPAPTTASAKPAGPRLGVTRNPMSFTPGG